jgi:hypothetical protein
MVPSPKPMVTVEVIKQPPKVVHGIEDVGKSIATILKVATAVTPRKKLIVAPLPTVSKVQPRFLNCQRLMLSRLML